MLPPASASTHPSGISRQPLLLLPHIPQARVPSRASLWQKQTAPASPPTHSSGTRPLPCVPLAQADSPCFPSRTFLRHASPPARPSGTSKQPQCPSHTSLQHKKRLPMGRPACIWHEQRLPMGRFASRGQPTRRSHAHLLALKPRGLECRAPRI